MGDKYKLKRSVVKKRPKKRGKYRAKPHDPKKPRTNDEKEEIFPGYKEQSRLARGILEKDAIPDNWGKLMSDDPSTQDAFSRKLKDVRSNMGSDNTDVDWNDPQIQLASDISDRLQKIQDQSPEFVKHLTYLVEPITNYGNRVTNTDHPQALGEAGLEERAKGKHSKTSKSISQLKPDEIKAMCQKRFNLMTLDGLLALIDRLNRASSGRLREPIKPK